MKKIQGAPLLVSLLAGAGVAVLSLPVLANVDAECRQEAEEYAIPPEQLEDYVTGCILSRGGNYAEEPVVEDYTAPEEPEASTGDDAGTGSDDVPQ